MILIKYSEIALKRGNRSWFEKQLVDNIVRQAGLKPGQVKRLEGRIVITGEYNKTAIAKDLARVFGVHSFAFAVQVALELPAIEEVVADYAQETSNDPETTYAVNTVRADKSFPRDSQEVNERLGKLIGTLCPTWSVDLDSPDITFHIEIRRGGAFIYIDKDEHAGPAGLPAGTGGKALALLSGGIDSPVATWQMMRRGVHVDAIYFHSPPFVGEKTRQKVADLVRILKEWSPLSPKLFVVTFSDVQVELKKAPQQYWTLLFRRSMHRIAEKIAQKEEYNALVTGDNLGQVASQTIENIGVIDDATDMWVARPLVAAEKQETIVRAKQIGTYRTSIEPYEDCCTVFTPAHPSTHTTVGDLAKEEAQISGLADLEKEAVENVDMV